MIIPALLSTDIATNYSIVWFQNQNAYFTDGVQDEILTDLAKIADLKVVGSSAR